MCCSVVGRPMVQDIPEQEMLVVEGQELPQMDPEPEMGAAAAEAAVYDTSPPPLHQNPPPIPAETPHQSAPDMAQLFAMLAEVNANMQAFISDMRTQRGETRQMGQCLQTGKMATPRVGADKLGGSATAVRPAVPAGEDRVIRETCRVTEKVTETVTREKLNGGDGDVYGKT